MLLNKYKVNMIQVILFRILHIIVINIQILKVDPLKTDLKNTMLISKSRLNTEGRSANCPWYYEFKHVDPGDVGDQDTLRMNPIDASKYGIKDGDKVLLTSVASSGECVARVWEGVRPGTVSKSYGQGHWAYGKTAFKI